MRIHNFLLNYPNTFSFFHVFPNPTTKTLKTTPIYTNLLMHPTIELIRLLYNFVGLKVHKDFNYFVAI